MSFERLQNGLRVKMGSVLIGINPTGKFSANFYIFTKEPEEEFSKMIYLPGEYEIDGIFIFGYGNKEVNYLLVDQENDERLLILESEVKIPENLEIFLDKSFYVLVLSQRKDLREILREVEIEKLVLTNTSQNKIFENFDCEVINI